MIAQLIVLLAVIISGEMFRTTATSVEICVVAEQSKETNRNSKAEKPDVFANVRPTLRKATDVPLRLPEFIPDVSSDNPAYAILESVDRHNYEVQLAWSSDCNGGNACHYGAVRGSINPLLAERRKKIPVRLQHGIKGYFVGFTCGAHCDDSSVGWREGEHHYSISLKAGKMRDLVKMANSAITSTDK